MPVKIWLYEFSIPVEQFENNEKQVLQVLKQYVKEMEEVFRRKTQKDGLMILYTGESGSTVSIRHYPQGHLTINIEAICEEKSTSIIPPLTLFTVEKELADALQSSVHSVVAPIWRGLKLNRYNITSDERIVEYDFNEMIYDEYSPYQRIQIINSASFGRALLLDSLLNLAATDIAYTETLMQKGKECYTGKEIVILGGGDGALLHELLKENPKRVILLELDEMVVKACREHMRICCGDALDNMKGPNHEIIIGDCNIVLDRFIENGDTFDYVFGDLTDFPLNSTEKTEMTLTFLKSIMNKSLKIMKPTGKYMAHCCGVTSTEIVEQYNKMLTTLDSPVEYSTVNALVPSFMEYWLFYQIWKKQQ